jgi:F420H(2)-dependent biliverdin reductase
MSRLGDDKNVWLATVRADGRPHVAPIWFVFVDGRFWLCTGESSVKVRNIRVNPKVSVCLEDGNAPVVAEGSAVVHAQPFPAAVVAAFGAKFVWDITRAEDDDLGALALIEIAVDRWLMGGPDS